MNIKSDFGTVLIIFFCWVRLISCWFTRKGRITFLVNLRIPIYPESDKRKDNLGKTINYCCSLLWLYTAPVGLVSCKSPTIQTSKSSRSLMPQDVEDKKKRPNGNTSRRLKLLVIHLQYPFKINFLRVRPKNCTSRKWNTANPEYCKSPKPANGK